MVLHVKRNHYKVVGEKVENIDRELDGFIFVIHVKIVTDGMRRALVSCLSAFPSALDATVYSVLVVRISESPAAC
jgi:hypothetical protein